LAILVLGLISYGSYYVVFVLLWPFFSPIMWALMTGLVIHPHKTYLAAAMRQTLADMAASEKTTIVAVLYGCVGLVDGACEAIGGYVVAKWKMVSAIAVVFGVVQATMTLDPVNTLVQGKNRHQVSIPTDSTLKVIPFVPAEKVYQVFLCNGDPKTGHWNTGNIQLPDKSSSGNQDGSSIPIPENLSQ
jgi:hypothetical protein